MGRIEDWWAAGERVPLDLRGAERAIFVRRLGDGAPATLLHGFPSSSHDWAKLAPSLAMRHAVLMPDFLGFGDSDKPQDHDYSLSEQADLVEALWEREGVSDATLIAHDYGVSVAQELLARRADGALAVELAGVHLLNGGLYPDVHRPQPVQEALLDPEQGPQISAAMTPELVAQALRPTFADDHYDPDDSADIAASMARRDGHLISYRLIRYMVDRRANDARWVGALEKTDVPLRFVWGMLDPISGAHMAERIRERVPGAPFVALEDVGHWPPLEAPERVAAALLAG